jgi:hypothetical protein
MEWEYFWSTLIIESPQLAQEDIKMTQKVEAFKKAMRRAYNAGRDRGRLDRDHELKAANDFANIGKHAISKDEAKAAMDALGEIFQGFNSKP